MAAVVLHVLVATHPQVLTLEQVIAGCERNPKLAADRGAVELALQSLIDDGLAYRRGARFAPTRAAIRALELSF